MEIIRKQGRNSAEILAALKLDALNPLSQEAAEEIERLGTAIYSLIQEKQNMERVVWALLKQHGPFWVSAYRLKRAPAVPRFRFGRNAFNDDVKLESVDDGQQEDAESAAEN